MIHQQQTSSALQMNKSSSSASTSTKPSSSSSTSSTNSSALHYLIAYGHMKPPKPLEEETVQHPKFMSRHDSDGKFIYVDPCVHSIIGCMPNQLISESIFNLVHPEDVHLLRKAFQEAIGTLKNHKIRTYHYRFRLDSSSLNANGNLLFFIFNYGENKSS
jgi:hypothetical protein